MQIESKLQKEIQDILVTIPCYKDTSFLEEMVDNLELQLQRLGSKCWILIAEDVSDSSRIITRIQTRYNNILYIHSSKRQGRVNSLLNAWKRFHANAYVYMDADGATSLTALGAFDKLLNGVVKDGNDLVVGSRYSRRSRTKRPFVLRIFAMTYNLIIRILFRTGLTDHQCGFRAFSPNAVEILLRLITADEAEKRENYNGAGFADTEAIVLLKRLHLKVKEIPVYWTERKVKRLDFRRYYLDIRIALAKIESLLVKSHQVSRNGTFTDVRREKI